MARANNKYASVNFNDIYDKKLSPKPSSSSTATHLQKPQFAAVTRNNGRMLVLTRPTPKPQPQPQTSPPQSRPSQHQTLTEPDPISLRPLGRTGSGPSLTPIPQQPLRSPKPDRFVPPHLRPGFVAPKDTPGPEKQPGFRSGEFGRTAAQFGSPNRYERMNKGADADRVENRPNSGGNRPNSSG